MRYLTTTQAAKARGLTRQRLSRLILEGRVPEAIRAGKFWFLPEDFTIALIERKAKED